MYGSQNRCYIYLKWPDSAKVLIFLYTVKYTERLKDVENILYFVQVYRFKNSITKNYKFILLILSNICIELAYLIPHD